MALASEPEGKSEASEEPRSEKGKSLEEEVLKIPEDVIESESEWTADEAPVRQRSRSQAETPEKKVSAKAAKEIRNFLAMYFKEMAALSVMRPEEEFNAAREIESLEFDLWETLLSYPPSVDLVTRVVERALENCPRDLLKLRDRVRRYKDRPSRTQIERLHESARAVASQLRALDIDRKIVALGIHEVVLVARGEQPRIAHAKLTFSPGSAAFKKYVGKVRLANNRVQAAKNAFVKANLRLVVSIARRFNHGRMPFADLIQEGNIGLMKAVDRFDYRRGYRFSTYASWWIRHAISRALADKGRAVRLPVHMIDAYHRVAKASRELTAKLGRPPTPEQIGQAAGMDTEKVERMQTFLLEESFSLDRPVSDEDGRRFIDFLTEPEGTPTITDRLSTQAVVDEVLTVLGELKPIEADILRQRFGLETDEERTLKEIGDQYRLSRERIRQLQEQALSKVRKALERKELL